MKAPRLIPSLAALLLLSASALAQPATFPISLTRPDKPNTTFDIHLTLDRITTRTTIDASSPGTLTLPEVDALKADLAGRLQVIKVNPSGMPALMTITVKSFVNSATQIQLIPEGTVITITRGDAKTPTAATLPDGTAVSPEALTILASWYSPDNNAPSDDDTFGTKTPHAVGETWKATTKAVVEGLRISGLSVKPEDVDGTATLNSVDKTEAGPVMRVTMNLAAKNFRPLGIPDTVTVDSAQTKMTYEKILPQDPSGPNLSDNMSIDMQIKMHGGSRTVSVNSRSVTTGTYALLGK